LEDPLITHNLAAAHTIGRDRPIAPSCPGKLSSNPSIYVKSGDERAKPGFGARALGIASPGRDPARQMIGAQIITALAPRGVWRAKHRWYSQVREQAD
jgi:hypothetical protein